MTEKNDEEAKKGEERRGGATEEMRGRVRRVKTERRNEAKHPKETQRL